ncbi:HpcH/HpaI aldolase family protein [Pukyongiella litopenaei]|uniref:Hydroxypyruvate/pyruvate aldolase n=1 Tax=Pukyongiella litopenaei TaxID=2605946 RepID=A0A2S0MQK6_9RHOB|nr:aldolase/citrate lyase family protein [Pukyongiella litopenaei]AVO38169.1 4-hydroxy-2-oxo-heptane-1,7-dioate aldolase [Pukyongiella litopenaei]
MPAPRNLFKQRLLAGETQLGLWMSLASPVAAEALSLLDFDWLLFDTEHAPVEIAQLQALLQAAAAGTPHCAARPAWNDKVLIKRILDVGAQTLLVPFVQTAEEAAAAVAATRYPPDGIRGVAGGTRASRYGTEPDYLTTANREICTIVQIETRAALDQIEAICAVDGVDGIFIGPSDLSASLGHLGNPSAPQVQEQLRLAADRVIACGKSPGILATTAADAKRYREMGYLFIACGVDLGLLSGAARGLLAEMGKA